MHTTACLASRKTTDKQPGLLACCRAGVLRGACKTLQLHAIGMILAMGRLLVRTDGGSFRHWVRKSTVLKISTSSCCRRHCTRQLEGSVVAPAYWPSPCQTRQHRPV